MIGNVLQADLEEIIKSKNWDELREALSELPPVDIAEVLIDLPVEDEGVIFRVLPRKMAALVFSYLPLDRQEELLHCFSNEQVRSILDQMTPDDRTRLLEETPAEVTRRLLETLSPDELKSARLLLGYPEGSAGRYMTPEYVALSPELTAAAALEQIRKTGRGKETLNVVYIVENDGKLISDLRLGSLVLAPPEQRVVLIEDRPLVALTATATKSEVLAAFERYDRVALPVTDAAGHMLGIITVDDVLDVAEEKATEEMQKMGGMEALEAPYMEVGFWPMIKKRGGWLSILFIGQMLTATAMGFFGRTLELAGVVMMLFVPLIISSGGNSGSQATSLMIRSLALKELNLDDWWRVLRRELATGATLGAFLGLLGFIRIIVWHHAGWSDFRGHPYALGITVWVSVIGVVMFGSVVGSMLPFILRRFGLDPAASSAPFVATLVDVTGLVIYFTVAVILLSDTLLARPPAATMPAR